MDPRFKKPPECREASGGKSSHRASDTWIPGFATDQELHRHVNPNPSITYLREDADDVLLDLCGLPELSHRDHEEMTMLQQCSRR